jgi:hypothetical protein
MALANSGISAVELNRLYLAWALPLAGLLAVLVFRPQASPAALRRIGSRSREEVLPWAD